MTLFKHRHFTNHIIISAVRWYCKYGISYRELEEMLEERGVDVDHSTINRWVLFYGGCCMWQSVNLLPQPSKCYLNKNHHMPLLARCIDRE